MDQKRKVALPPCPRCQGKLYLDVWEKPPDLACLRCGWRVVFQEEDEPEEDESKENQ